MTEFADGRDHPFLRVSGRNGRGKPNEYRLEKCPAPDCREPIDDGPRSVPQHIGSHGPEDFGLSPVGSAGRDDSAGGERA